MKPKSIQAVVDSRLCVGCGACAFVSEGAIKMREVPKEGWRPTPVAGENAPEPTISQKVCPVIESDVPVPQNLEIHEEALRKGLGPIVEMWEVHATDEGIRHAGASGGALSALASFALEQRGMGGVLHIAQDENDPFRNKTVLSQSKQELLDRTGSRYAPTSLCDRLDLIEKAGAPCAVIGQPSEIAALRKVESVKPELSDKVGITMSFFCAGAPSMQGTVDLIKSKGVDPKTVTEIRYRGRGWPGQFAICVQGKDEPVIEMTYAESWAFLQSYRAWGVHLWPDGAGEHADVSCGDPWYRKVEDGELGSSLVLARNERGRDFVREAISAGYLKGEKIEWQHVAKSQENLLTKKGSIAGRLLGMTLLGLPTPQHRGYQLQYLWGQQGLGARVKDVLGTMRRILQRKRQRDPIWGKENVGALDLSE